LTGSISHAGDTCVVAVAATRDFMSIGIDIEYATPLSPELHATVCSAEELSSFASTTHALDGPKILFAVKEAFFKFYHPVAGHFLDFRDVSVRLDLARRRFHLRLRDELPAVQEKRSFEGIFGLADRFCFAFITHRS
jgi:4'-phosphopantetheinyl transferase EntD